MGDFFELPAGFIEQWVGFWATFSRPRFGAIGSKRDLITYHIEQEILPELLAQLLVSGRRDGGAVLAKCVQSPFEADALQIRFVEAGGFGHDTARQVVGNEEREHLLACHGRTLATQDFHAQSRLDIAQAHFQSNRPAEPCGAREAAGSSAG